MPCTDDGSEDFDDQSNPESASAGLLEDRTVCDGDEDWFQISVPAGQVLTVNLTFSDEEGDIDLEILDSVGNNVVGSTTATDDESATTPVAEAATSYYVRVWLWGDGGLFGGNDYDVEFVVEIPPPPPTCTDDAFEPNDTFAEAVTLLSGTQSALTVCTDDPSDWFAIDLAMGEQLTVTAAFLDDEGDVDIKLYDATETQIGLAGVSTTDDETVDYTATAAGLHWINVYLYADAGTLYGNTYALTLTIQ